MTEEKSEYKANETWTTPPLPPPMKSENIYSGNDPLADSNRLMYHGINSGLFLYGSAWTSAIVMAWCMFLGVVQAGALQWVLIGLMILIGILNYPVKNLPKESKKDERTDKH